MTMFRESGGADEEVDSLIAAAELQGVEKGRTEGAEQERERILAANKGIKTIYDQHELGVFEAWIIPCSVLSPKAKP
jgi:hypothetical protein